MNVGIYLRKSRAADGVQDLLKHKDYLINVANKNNWTYEPYKKIEDSQNLLRPELQRLRYDIELDKIIPHLMCLNGISSFVYIHLLE